MNKALLISTLTLFVLGLTARSESNDVTGINAAKTASAARREAQGNATTLADPQHKVVMQAPNPSAMPQRGASLPLRRRLPHLSAFCDLSQGHRDDCGSGA